jgi:hypothetical protein
MNEINTLYTNIENCSNWNEKIKLIELINNKINEEELSINNKIESLNNIIKITKKKINIDDLVDNFEKTINIEEKILMYQDLNALINKLNFDLFTN